MLQGTVGLYSEWQPDGHLFTTEYEIHLKFQKCAKLVIRHLKDIHHMLGSLLYFNYLPLRYQFCSSFISCNS